ncbi:hypothetical protein GALMADRAFT_270003 [Galerina marginata CBS 339.88]|uniref:DUF6533 domain-containing protein n=1 Tax=Galerina marginata (strain CBS 339.88) TaxID=685588 RepID=A0A067T1J0_GALM3|nr:hypothetical protein GALMADRAFT_270003 [Galerina marginata CBS 339.88]
MSEHGLGLITPFLLGAFQGIQVTRFARMASNSIVLYDYLITMDKEVELFWKSKWSIPKALFFVNRYYILFAAVFSTYAFFARVDGLTAAVSLKYLHWEGWTGLAAAMLAQAILQMRLYALYMRDKKILGLMLFFYVALSAVSAWIMWTDLAQFIVTIVSFAGGVPRLYIFYIPLMLFDGLLFVLAVFRGIQEAKSTGSLFHRGQSLIEILIRDSIFYFLIIGLIYLVCILCLKFEPPPLIDASIGFAPAMSGVLASRVLFNLREAGLETSLVYSNTQEVQFR